MTIPFEVSTPCGCGTLKVRSNNVVVLRFCSVRVYCVLSWSEDVLRGFLRNTNNACFDATNFPRGFRNFKYSHSFALSLTFLCTFVDGIGNDVRVWEWVRNEHFGSKDHRVLTFLELRELIAHFRVVAGSIRGTGFWLDPASLTLLSQRSPAEDLSDLILYHREETNQLQARSRLEITGISRLEKGAFHFAKHRLVIMMDTSMVLRNLSYLVEVVGKLNKIHSRALFDCFLHVPWFVMSEIHAFANLEDSHTSSHTLTSISRLARTALDRLNYLGSRFEVTLETQVEFEDALKMHNTIKRRSKTSDLLYSCLGVIRGTLFPDHCHGRFVLFLSDDWELIAEAAMHGIACCDSSTLFRDHADVLHIANRAFALLPRAKSVLGLKGINSNSIRSREFEASMMLSSQDEGLRTSVVNRTPMENSLGQHVGYWRNILAAGKTAMAFYFGPVFQFFLQIQNPNNWSLPLETAAPWSFPKLVWIMEQAPGLPASIQPILKALNQILKLLREEGPLGALVLRFYQICHHLIQSFVFVFVLPLPLYIAIPKGFQYVDLDSVRILFMEVLSKMSLSSAFIEGVLSSDPKSWNQQWMNPFSKVVQTQFFEKVFYCNTQQNVPQWNSHL